MARIESTALGGYYPTPAHLIPAIASKIQAMPVSQYAWMDPCAGDGEAVLDLITAIHPKTDQVQVYTVELESTRYTALKSNLETRISNGWRAQQQCLHSDAFKVNVVKDSGITGLYLNPPYDTDPIHGRLEQKFLHRFAPALMGGGVLLFVVPYYALEKSADFLATEFDTVRCYRFPDPDYTAYKQVVLIATKRSEPLLSPDTEIQAQIAGWLANPLEIPILEASPEAEIVLPVNTYLHSFKSWEVRGTDFPSLLAKISPWSMTDKRGAKTTIPGILPEGAIEDLLTRKYPLAMPPRPAHIAAGIAAGVFNGAKISPDDSTSKLPDILVKGVFDKEFKTVDEKVNKDGEVVGEIQIQQPKLVTTVLDLSTNKYTTIISATHRTNLQKIEGMTMADLLAHYGRGLMDVMLQQCPVMHDPRRPEDSIPLPTLARPLYKAQEEATRAAIKLLGGLDAKPYDRRFKAAFVLGEIGSGKTSVALSTAQAIKAKRVLVMCPPHLLASWQEQIQTVTPWFRTTVLSDITDVQKLAGLTDDVPTIAILSREAAKLGHAYNGIDRCGKCGTKAPVGDHAKKRSRCQFKPRMAKDSFGPVLMDLAMDLLYVNPADARIAQMFTSEHVERIRQHWILDETPKNARWSTLKERGNLRRVILRLATSKNEAGRNLLEAMLTAVPDPEFLRAVAKVVHKRGMASEGFYDNDDLRFARRILLLAPLTAETATLIEGFQATETERSKDAPENTYYSRKIDWKDWFAQESYLWGEGTAPSYGEYYQFRRDYSDREKRMLDRRQIGHREDLLDVVLAAYRASFTEGEECGEPLYQSIPEPRRYPIATFITRNYPKLFDLFIGDEAQELSSDTSAQGRCNSRIMSLGIPTLLLSGSIMGGYAASIYGNIWSASPDFRSEFDKGDESRFIDRFGYRKRLVEDREKESGKIVEYGSMSDRVQRSERMIGEAPGILPLFLLRYLLPISVTLHKADLALDIPKCTESVEKVTVQQTIHAKFDRLKTALIAQIKRDRFDPDLSGKLWGAMAQLPSFFDLCTEDTGNNDSGTYEIRYPESVGGGLVASETLLPAETILPKEQWLIDRVKASLARGRNVLILGWHTRLIDRLSRVLEKATGEKCPTLNPAKVPTHKRQAWINKEIIGKKRRILISNPTCVQTGLNNLVYFADELWMENPGVNAVTYRQTMGRIDRIGQKNPTESVFPLYEDTPQETLHSLLLHKVAVSMSVDGLDAESAMSAAGIGETDGFSSFSVGKFLFDMLTQDVTA